MSFVRVFPAFALTALILAMVPGQGVAMVLRQCLVGGARCAMASVFGNATGLIIWGTSAAVGLSQVFAHSQLAYNILKFAGVAYLSFLAVLTLVSLRRSSGAFDTNTMAVTQTFAAYRLGLITNLTNVKAAVFAVAFIPQFVPRSFPLGPGIVVLSFVQAVVSLAWYTGLVAAVHRGAPTLTRPTVRRVLTAISAVGLLTLALVLLLSSSR
ncbi:MAG: LysE family translocator [Acidimicrobiaceae bacterium]|nr:LysE family translocator [Acidimicrobiaceae bacterium]